MQTQIIHNFIAKQYDILPEYLFRKYPDCAVFRHPHNRKWFALTMTVSGSKIDAQLADNIPIMNVKLPPEWVAQLSGQHGFAPAYHMNKRHWLSVRLDGTLPETQLIELLQESFLQTQ